ncbi:esterase [Antarcticibacterium sp. 1MA-6-2]|uniref:alpha/beta hydrolase n=1 Tax=Antarcticibacterium sp. 1MA-6-2 TaxID=2908210 RepID=UPI001EEA3772|nr:alpha/beta hydrolase-fold protein [Antarcticibacterium sp. 1MA-6-2]UJH89964.1 esterase [Antarcticibacterium sp. 1MA-6-2]
MARKLLFLLLLVAPFVTPAQVTYQTIQSSKLGETRELKIQLPRNYEQNKDKVYPVMLVLDGDYLFEPVAGNVDYYSYWEDIPEMIVVGVNQVSTREEDAFYDNQRFLPADKGAKFFEFLGMELLPFVESKYRTAPFRVIVGHDFTSNFINYYLLKETPLFQGYINLSPDLAPEMANRVASSLERSTNKTWYYLATSGEDIPSLKEEIIDFDAKLAGITNKNLFYNFDNFEDATHYTLVGNAIPKAIEQIFQVYRPISIQDYNRILLQTSVSAYDYLVEKYESIHTLFGIDKTVRINDFMAVYNAMEKTRNWEGLKDLSKLAAKNYPKTMLATYFDARYEEEIGDPKKAMRSYQNAYGQEPVAFLTVDFMLEKAEKIKNDFGY